MAHVQDLWEKTVGGRRIRTSRYGKGNRWQARYLDPDGHERTRTFARKQDAERFVVTVRADVLRGAYVDPDAGKVTFAEFAERWLAAQTFDESSREAPSCGFAFTAAVTSATVSCVASSRRSSRPGCASSSRRSPPATCAPCSPTSPASSTPPSTTGSSRRTLAGPAR